MTVNICMTVNKYIETLFDVLKIKIQTRQGSELALTIHTMMLKLNPCGAKVAFK